MAENKATFTVRGIDSGAEAGDVEDELAALDGVMGATVDPDTGETAVRYDVDLLAEARIEITVREMGYEVESDAGD